MAAAWMVLIAATLAGPREGWSQWTQFHAGEDWRTLETRHFLIHAPRRIEPLARRLAVVAEEVHREVVVALRWEPSARTHLVLTDQVDREGAYSELMPWPRVQLFTAKPDLHGRLGKRADALRAQLEHEYAHVVAADMHHGLSWGWRAIFGRGKVLFPNRISPAWLREGVAGAMESGGVGGLGDTYTAMVMRSEVAAGRFKGADEASVIPRSWPRAQIPLIYGVGFEAYLREAYGEGKWREYLHLNSAKAFPTSDHMYILPFLYNRGALEVWGENFLSLWEEFEGATRESLEPQIARLRAEGLTAMRRVSAPGTWATGPRFSTDGAHLYFVAGSNRGSDRLMVADVEGGAPREVAALRHGGAVAVGGDGAVFASDEGMVDRRAWYADVFEWRPGERRLERQSRGARVREFDVLADREQVAWVREESGLYSLVVSGLDFEDPRVVLGPTRRQLQYLRADPEGRRVAFSFKDDRGQVDVAVIDLEGAGVERVTDDASLAITPTWHPDGDRLLYVSDRDGVYNLYSHDLEEGRVQRLTNVLGGVFWPEVSPGGRSIALVEYSAEGMRVALMDYPRAVYGEHHAEPKAMGLEVFEGGRGQELAAMSAEVVAARPYSPWGSLAPSSWTVTLGAEPLAPGVVTPRIGARTGGRDALWRHRYRVAASLGLRAQNLHLDGRYTYSPRWPEWRLTLRDEQIFVGADRFPYRDDSSHADDYFRRTLERSAGLGVTLPRRGRRFERGLTLELGVTNRRVEESIPAERASGVVEVREWAPTHARLALAYRLSDARRYPASISPEDGQTLAVLSDYYAPLAGGAQGYWTVSGRYRAYLPGLMDNDVFMVGVKGGWAPRAPSYLAPFSLGSTIDGVAQNQVGRAQAWGIRGYPALSYFGGHAAVATGEYRLPLAQADRGLGTFPIVFRNLWLTPFVDIGEVGSAADLREPWDYKVGAGAQLHVELRGGYVMDVDAFVGVARGFHALGQSAYYFGLSFDETPPSLATGEPALDLSPNHGASEAQWRGD